MTSNIIKDMLSINNILINSDFENKSDFVKSAAKHLFDIGICSNAELFCDDVFAREQQANTDLDEGVAIPHAKSSSITRPTIVATTLSRPWKNSSIDGKDIGLVFLLAMPNLASDEHLKALSSLSLLLLQDGFIESLQEAKTSEEFLSVIDKYSQSGVRTSDAVPDSSVFDIVAVTSCPVGIAHTYLAAEKLTTIAQKLGLKIKVETQGSIGAENILSDDDIKGAKVAILACDRKIDMNRFVGKPILEVGVKDAIRDAENIINKAMNGGAKIFGGVNVGGDSTSGNDRDKSGVYRYLMGGVSSIIPLVVVGGVYIALAIALSGVKADAGVSISNPLLQKMEEVGGLAFGLLIPILAGFIAMSIADRPGLVPGLVGGALASKLGMGFLGGIIAGFVAGFVVSYILKIKVHKNFAAIMPVFVIPLVGTALTVIILYIVGAPIALFMESLTNILRGMSTGSILLGAVLGAMIAFDMGGPVNKVAFLFAVSMIQAGVPQVMGIVAVAICTPPIGVWLATLISPMFYTEQEREAGRAALMMGLIGITEGAIPFAVANPLRVIPSLMLGSMVGGMLAAFWGVADHAPHGGLIVLPVVDHRIWFIVSVVIGVVVTAVTLNTLLKIQRSKEKIV